jgi:hypothetical protein
VTAAGVKAKPKRKRKLTLQGLVRFLIEGGENSLKVTFDLPNRESLQRAVWGLGPCAQSLVSIIEGSGIPEHQRALALIHLRSALAFAYTIGADGTMSENTKAAIYSIRTREMREEGDKRRCEDPENQIIMEAVERVGSDVPRHKAIAIAANAAHNALPAQDGKGKQRGRDNSGKLTYEAVRARTRRMLEKVRS